MITPRFHTALRAAVVLISCILMPLRLHADVNAADLVEIDIGMSVADARGALQDNAGRISVDSDDAAWHILIAEQSGVTLNLLFEEDRLRYVSYDFFRAAFAHSEAGSSAHCKESFDAAIALMEKSYGKGDKASKMAWPEREFTMTWRGDQHYAVARQLSDVNGCLLVKALVFDGNEAAFKEFDARLRQLK
jgi:hypothetical protein